MVLLVTPVNPTSLFQKNCFPDEGWIQNPPNSPHLAYPIEELWAFIKPRVKRRDPQTVEELKQYLLENNFSKIKRLDLLV